MRASKDKEGRFPMCKDSSVIRSAKDDWNGCYEISIVLVSTKRAPLSS
jgi:hypothetical protein